MTTRSYLTFNTLKHKAFLTGSGFHERWLWIMVPAGLFLLFIPNICMASTPPVQPSLLLEVSDLPANLNATLTLSVTWNGYVSFNKPPEQIIVNMFSVPGGSRLGTLPIPRLERACTSENTCRFSTSVEVEDFPSGTFMLIATDPLSGATTRQTISIPLHSKGNSEFFNQFEYDQRFLVSSAMLGVFLAGILAILVREKI